LLITFINQENKGKGAALNAALERVHGEFYATLDADSVVEPHVLKRLLPYFVDDSVACVLPLLKIKDPTNMLQRIQRYEYIINMFHKMLNSMLEAVHVAPGPFSLFRTSVVQKLGNYDEHNITEDLEIALRLQKHQYKIIQTAETAVYTMPPDNLKDLYRQRNRWYKGAIINAYTYKALMFKKEYGDFGVARLPTVILGGLLSIVVLLTLAFDLADSLIRKVFQLSLINFDIMTLIRNWSFNFNILDLQYVEISIAFSVLFLGILVMIASFSYCKEKITRYGRTFVSMVSYMLIYSFIVSFVWLMIGIEIVRGKVQKW
jgi:cellulose synthase/poly-beta-1,6-N-acetylglucosamine synthase-like glycosyltransferase